MDKAWATRSAVPRADATCRTTMLPEIELVLIGQRLSWVAMGRFHQTSAGETRGNENACGVTSACVSSHRSRASMFAAQALAVCLAELRSSVRRVRTYVFVVVAAAGIVATLVLASQATSSVAPLAGAYAPRFVLSAMGNAWLWLFVIAVVFLAFDARQQDERARVAEVLDARPTSNLALLAGRLTGTVLIAWLALVAIAVLVQAVGTVARMVHEAAGEETATLAWWLAVVVEPTSLATLLTFDAVPALAFAAALVLFLATVLRRRLLTVLVALALVGAHVYAVAIVPMVLLPVVSLVTSYADFASDVVPTFPEPTVLAQRAVLVLFAIALLFASAALHSRDDGGSRLRRGMTAVLFAALGVAAIVGLVAASVDDFSVRERWLAAQEAARELPFPDLRHVGGEVRIEPGKNMALDLDLRIAAPPGKTLARLHFSLNPGLTVGSVEIAGEPARATHVDGILTVDLPRPVDSTTELPLSLRASGMPDSRFAYLDSAVDWRRLPASNRLNLLGTDASVFSRSYVALMPGVAWLPTTGPNLAGRRADAFAPSLTVRVPAGWLVAGPGRREPVAVGAFRFEPRAAVPEVGLFASRFERRTVEVAGVMLEILVVPEHAGQLDGLVEVMEDENGIIGRVEEMIDEAEESGLPYPFAGFSMVEVPARLRGYGGGRALDTTLFPPGLALVPEYGFPTRFERVHTDRRTTFGIGPNLATESADRKQGTLWRLFAHESAGGGLRHLARNAFSVGSAPSRDSAALDALCRVLAARIVWRLYDTDSDALFTAHRFTDESTRPDNPLLSLVWGGGPSQVRTAASRPTVWEAAGETALADLDGLADAALAQDVLALRIDHAVRAIQDRYGLEKAAALLVALRERLSSTGYSAEDLAQASVEAEMDIHALLGDWLGATAMPGFRASAVKAFRIPDADDGKPRYQVLLDIRNSEPTPGLVRLTYAGKPRAGRWVNSDPIPIAGDSSVHIGQFLAQPPEAVWVRTYLSRNRAEMRLPVASFDAEEVVEREVFAAVRPSDWIPEDRGIVVDDLDGGFGLESADDASRLGGGTAVSDGVETDAGLPIFRRDRRPGWTRQALPTAWGRYRRTVARIAAGQGTARANFDAELPEAGRWLLSYHVPDLEQVGMYSYFRSTNDDQGVHGIEVYSGDTTTTVDFDAAAATPGWNEIDALDLAAGPVRVTVSDKTSGNAVVADAIRWERSTSRAPVRLSE